MASHVSSAPMTVPQMEELARSLADFVARAPDGTSLADYEPAMDYLTSLFASPDFGSLEERDIMLAGMAFGEVLRDEHGWEWVMVEGQAPAVRVPEDPSNGREELLIHAGHMILQIHQSGETIDPRSLEGGILTFLAQSAVD